MLNGVMLKPNWNPKKLRDEANAWLGQATNREMFLTDQRVKLEQFINGAKISPSKISFAIGQIAVWFGNTAISQHLDQPADALLNLLKCVQYKYASFQIMIRANAMDKRGEKQGRLSFNEYGLLLGRLLSLGLFSEADSLQNGLERGLKNSLFYGIECTVATPFIAKLYAEAKGQTISFEGALVEEVQIYKDLVGLLRGHDLEKISGVLVKAGDYHVKRAQSSNDDADYEYDDDLDRIHPAELLAFLRLRQKLELPVPALMHPIANSSLAVLKDPMPFPADDFLQQVIDKSDTMMIA